MQRILGQFIVNQGKNKKKKKKKREERRGKKMSKEIQ
jgi:hypothetical protein